MPLPDLTRWIGEVKGPWLITTQLAGGERRQAPSELHLFEFADVDVSDPEALAWFSRAWGLPMDWSGSFDDVVTRSDDMGRVSYMQDLTAVAQALDVEPPPFSDDGDVLRPHRHKLRAVHHVEVALRVLLIRTYAKHLLAHSTTGEVAPVWQEALSALPSWIQQADQPEVRAWAIFADSLNDGLKPFQVRVTVPDWEDSRYPTSYEVACLAIYNDLASAAPYRVCASETCRRVFTRQRGRSQHYSRSEGVAYCSPLCARAQAQRERRRRLRAESS